VLDLYGNGYLHVLSYSYFGLSEKSLSFGGSYRAVIAQLV